MKQRLRRLLSEWAAHRAGRRPIDHSRMRRASRDIVGPTGYMLTRSVDELGRSGEAYMKSFDDHIPPSLFVSERDRTRIGQPMPLRERAIADVAAGTTEPDFAGYEDQFRRIDREAVDRLIGDVSASAPAESDEWPGLAADDPDSGT